MQFLELIVEKPEKIFNDFIVREENRKLGKAPIRYYMQGEQISVDDFGEILNENLVDHSKTTEQKPKKRIVRKVIKRIIKTKSEEATDKVKKDIQKNQSVKTVSDDRLIDLFTI
jgi:hypothetical protein